MSQTEYFSDDELEQFIKNIEENETCIAPEEITENVLKDIHRIEEKHSHVVVPLVKNPKKELAIYSIKVVVAIAASIAVLFLAPQNFEQLKISKESEQMSSESSEASQDDQNQSDSILGRISEKSNMVCTMLNDSTTNLISRGE